MHNALLRNGDIEAGGILIGNKISKNNFEVVDISVSETTHHASFTRFVRDTNESTSLLTHHFSQGTGFYLGEWHSHPNFSLYPSYQDVITMKKIIRDPAYGVTFVFLLIAHIINNELSTKAYCFHKELKSFVILE